MKHRAPRKKKKIAKKRKAVNDAMIMVQAAMISAQSYMQLAIISASPVRDNLPASLALKTLRVIEVTHDAAKGISNVMNNIKHWTHFVPNYRIR